MKAQRSLFENDEGSEGVFRRLPEEIRFRVSELLAGLLLKLLTSHREKEARDDR